MRNINYNISVLNIQLILLAQLNLFFYSIWVKKTYPEGPKFIS